MENIECMNNGKLLLNAEQIELKIQRLSNEIAERYYNIKELYCFAIEGQGHTLGKRIVKETQKLTTTKITLSKININKQEPIGSIKINKSILKTIKDKDIIYTLSLALPI